ncbi:hypothetical protein IFM89_038289 [Coptis chinensis]|uniref:Pentatricopeptide repeat-containing protein n=1 Tax=Coptis chinensis TaxID=261450 RepID=A0A835H2W3_9MAGN|nr:hypothetical protein IFM89_038289 [Coptis chinensis]
MASLSRILSRKLSTATAVAATTPTSTRTPMKTIVNNLFKQKKYTQLVTDFKKSAESSRFRAKHRVYEDTIRRLASAKRFKLIEEILEDHKKYNDITKEGFAIRLISLYGKAGMLEHAVKTFDELPELKCDRTVKSFNAILSACVESKNYDKVESMFREMPKKLGVGVDEFSYTIVIQAFCGMGNMDKAVLLLDEMEGKGLKPNLVTYNVLLHKLYEEGYCKDGKMDGAKRVYEDLVKSDLGLNRWTYDAYLPFLCEKEDYDLALELCKKSMDNNCKIDGKLVQAVVDGLVKNSKLEAAKRLVSLARLKSYAHSQVKMPSEDADQKKKKSEDAVSG